MFTGIIESVQKIKKIEGNTLEIPNPWLNAESGEDVQKGESISVNGVCLTVLEDKPKETLSFYLSVETLGRTHFGDLKTGSLVNLERALRLGDRLSGHLVQGHVDGLVVLTGIEKQGESFRLTFEAPRTLWKYCIEKGSITLDGISLTLNRVEKTKDGFCFDIQIIPHTWQHTRLHILNLGSRLNTEVDLIAKYVEKNYESKNEY